MGEMVQFSSNGAHATGYLQFPENGKGRGVVVIQEWWGLVDHIKDICDRFAAAGYAALAPDLQHGVAGSIVVVRHSVHRIVLQLVHRPRVLGPAEAQEPVKPIVVSEGLTRQIGVQAALWRRDGTTRTGGGQEPGLLSASGASRCTDRVCHGRRSNVALRQVGGRVLQRDFNRTTIQSERYVQLCDHQNRSPAAIHSPAMPD